MAKVKNSIFLRNHRVLKSVRGTRNFDVKPQDALLFHYRDSCIENLCTGQRTRIDKSARKFAVNLYSNVDSVCRAVFIDGVCPS